MTIDKIVIAALLSASTSCASIVSGTRDDVTITTDPPGATCDVLKEGVTVAHVDRTPANVIVARSYDDLLVQCSKADYQPAEATNTWGTNGWVFGNIIFGGLIGVCIDMADGAGVSYSPGTHIELSPTPTGYLDHN